MKYMSLNVISLCKNNEMVKYEIRGGRLAFCIAALK